MDESKFVTLAIDRETYNRLGGIASETRRSRQDVIRYLLDHVRMVGREIKLVSLSDELTACEQSDVR